MKKKRIVKIIIFLCMLSISYLFVRNALSFKYGDGILGLHTFYDLEDNTVDVLILGSSHAFEDFNTGVLYEDYGVASYVLAGSVQPLWNTYYYLTEALKTQSPSLVILEGYGTSIINDYSDNSRIIKNTFGIRNPIVRFQSIEVSAPPNTRDDYIYAYRLWHSRYTEYGIQDTKAYYDKPFFTDRKGFGQNLEQKKYDIPDIDYTYNNATELSEKTELYYRMIIELCKNRNIPLVILVSPYILNQEDHNRFCKASEIAAEYDIPFGDFNDPWLYNALNLDFSSDFADAGHLNNYGNEKFTRFIAENLLKEYNLPDRRNNPRYESWKMNALDLKLRRSDDELVKSDDIDLFVKQTVSRDGLTIFILPISDFEKLGGCLEEYFEGQLNTDIRSGGLYIYKEHVLSQIKDGINWDYSYDICHKQLYISSNMIVSSGKSSEEIIIDCGGHNYANSLDGIYLIVVDDTTQELVCVRQLTTDEEGEIVLR